MRGLVSLVGEDEVHVVAVRLDVEHLVVERLEGDHVEEHASTAAFDDLVAFLRPVGGLDAELDLAIRLVAAEAEPTTLAGELEDCCDCVVAELKHVGDDTEPGSRIDS
jgi:hypothetical protein